MKILTEHYKWKQYTTCYTLVVEAIGLIGGRCLTSSADPPNGCRKREREERTSVLEEHLAVSEEFGEEVHRWRCRGSPIHVPKELRPSKLPLDVRLRLDALVGVGHHRDQQVDEDDEGDDEVDPEDGLHQCDGPQGVTVHRGQVLRLHEAKQGEEEDLKGVEGWLDWRPPAAVAVPQGGVVGGGRLHRPVDGGQLEREARHEDTEDDEEADEVLHQVADDDGPRTEEVVEGEEVE